jgi:hypothetical protein
MSLPVGGHEQALSQKASEKLPDVGKSHGVMSSGLMRATLYGHTSPEEKKEAKGDEEMGRFEPSSREQVYIPSCVAAATVSRLKGGRAFSW